MQDVLECLSSVRTEGDIINAIENGFDAKMQGGHSVKEVRREEILPFQLLHYLQLFLY